MIAIFPEGRQALYERNAYSAAVLSGDLLFVSGQVGVDPDGTPIADPEQQIEKAFDNLEAVLSAAGCGFADVLDVTTFHVDQTRHFPAVMAAKARRLPDPPFPAWTAIGVSQLYDPAILFEIKVVARVPRPTPAA